MSEQSEKVDSADTQFDETLSALLRKANEEMRVRLVLRFVRNAVDDAPRYDPEVNPVPSFQDVGGAFATLDHIRRLLREHLPEKS